MDNPLTFSDPIIATASLAYDDIGLSKGRLLPLVPLTFFTSQNSGKLHNNYLF
jgi:hypothetical protein